MEAQRIVVKVGSSSLTDERGGVSEQKCIRLVKMLAHLHQEGHQVLLVSSGAIAAGLGKLGWDRAQITMPEKQAAAAVGQGLLVNMYEMLFAEYGILIAQLLLTRADIAGSRVTHVHNTMEALLSHGIIPIVNENDTVAVDEIRFGDNDTLSSRVAVISRADLLILLTDIDGMYTSDPRHDSGAELIHDIYTITEDLEQMAGGNGTSRGTGGMRSKIEAAKIGMSDGIDVIVASSSEPDVLERLMSGEKIGTRFHATGSDGQNNMLKEAK